MTSILINRDLIFVIDHIFQFKIVWVVKLCYLHASALILLFKSLVIMWNQRNFTLIIKININLVIFLFIDILKINEIWSKYLSSIHHPTSFIFCCVILAAEHFKRFVELDLWAHAKRVRVPAFKHFHFTLHTILYYYLPIQRPRAHAYPIHYKNETQSNDTKTPKS